MIAGRDRQVGDRARWLRIVAGMRALAGQKHNETLQPEYSTAERARRCDGRAPAGPKGPAAGCDIVPRNARQARTQSNPVRKPIDEAATRTSVAAETVSRPAGGRSPAATSEPMDVTAGETAPELSGRLDDLGSVQDGLHKCPRTGLHLAQRDQGANACAPESVTAGETAPASKPASPADLIRRIAAELDDADDEPARPPTDNARFAAALRAKRAAPPTAAPARPLPIATSREECALCGVPGFRGCAHQRPFGTKTD